MPRLAHGLVRDAAGVHDRDVRTIRSFLVAVIEQALADLLRIGIGDLAAQETNRERGHGERNSTRGGSTGRLPSHRAPAVRSAGSARGPDAPWRGTPR